METDKEISNNGQWTNSEIANQVISKYTGSSSSNSNKRKSNPISKDDEEYSRKRARNNVAVKKSREKAKNRIRDTQDRVEQLSKENEELQTKVTLLSKELNVLRALFTNGGFTLPCDLQLMNGSSAVQEHSPVSLANPTVQGDESIRQHMSLPVDHHEKSAFHSPEDAKIPPLRPMPRVVRDIPGHKSRRTHSPPRTTYTTEREPYKFNLKPDDYGKKTVKLPTCTAPPLLIQPGPSSISASSHYINSTQYKHETQHTSVIRSATELSGSSYSVGNTLGKFCIIQDPEDNGQVKIVPIST